MLITNFFKLFSYAKLSRNPLLYFSTNSFLHSQSEIFPFTKSKIKHVNDSYYLNYLTSRMDYYSSVYDIKSLLTKNESDPRAIKLLMDFNNDRDFPVEENFFNEILNYTRNEFSNYGVDEICKIIALISKYRFHALCKIQMKNIKHCIDRELLKKNFSKNESLKIMFTLISTFNNNIKVSPFYFHYRAILKLLGKIDTLNTQEIVQTFFCIPAKDFSKTESKFLVLSYLNDIISTFNSDELGIVVQGLARGNITFSHENICSNLMDKTRNEIKNIHTVPFLSICKALQKFLKISDAESFSDFQEKIVPYVSNLNQKSLLSLVSVGYKYKILNSSLRETVIKKWKECIDDFTYSEIVSLIHVTVAFKIQDEELLLLAIKNLEKIHLHSTVQRHEYSNLVFVLNNLSFHRLYPKKLVDEVFSESFFNEVFKNSFGGKQKANWWSLYCNVKLEKPEYGNKEFSSLFLNKIYKKSRYTQTKLLYFTTKKFYFSLRTIENILEEIYGKNKAFVVDVLPHFSKGIVMRFNKKFEAQEIPEVFRSSDAQCFKKPLEDNHVWIFVLLLKKSDFLWGTDSPDLIHETQLRQLKALGYKILKVEIQTLLWTLKENNEKAYIINIINDCLTNISNEIK